MVNCAPANPQPQILKALGVARRVDESQLMGESNDAVTSAPQTLYAKP